MRSDKTKLLYATDGTIVQRLLKDPSLKDFDAVIIDEAHERKVQIDFTYNKEEPLKREEETKEIIITNPLNYINNLNIFIMLYMYMDLLMLYNPVLKIILSPQNKLMQIMLSNGMDMRESQVCTLYMLLSII